MKVKRPHDPPGTEYEVDGEDLVRYAVKCYSIGGDVDAAFGQIETLCYIVGRLVERLPESEWLEITGANLQRAHGIGENK